MSITVESVAQESFRQKISAGAHTFFADARPEHGGEHHDPSPHDLLLGAWGACTSMTIQMYAHRKGWALSRVQVTLREVQGGRAPVVDKHITLHGQLSAEQQERLVAVAERCLVNLFLMNPKTVRSQWRYEPEACAQDN